MYIFFASKKLEKKELDVFWGFRKSTISEKYHEVS